METRTNEKTFGKACNEVIDTLTEGQKQSVNELLTLQKLKTAENCENYDEAKRKAMAFELMKSLVARGFDWNNDAHIKSIVNVSVELADKLNHALKNTTPEQNVNKKRKHVTI